MFYGQIPLQKANQDQAIVVWQDEDISADFNDNRIAASFIKNYKELKISVVADRV